MDGLEDEDEVENAGSEHDNISTECETQDGNCKDTEAETEDRNGEQNDTGEVE
jgi:hypothetical protein